MKSNSLEPIFLNVTTDISPMTKLADGNASPEELHTLLNEVPFNAVYDFFRSLARKLSDERSTTEAIERIIDFDSMVMRSIDDSSAAPDLHIALMQILTALYIYAQNHDEALSTAATALNLLAQDPRRKDEAFLSILASLLYDISLIHNERGQYKQAEREIEKAMKLFERLAKQNPERYGPAHILALDASTDVYRSRIKQVNMLAHHQVATTTYMQMVNSGIEDASNRLIESIATEGRTLSKMGRHREAIQYFTRALKYLTKLDPTFTKRHLELSIDLGEALLNVKTSRDKGIHLLNTMLHKAIKINAEDEHRRIVDILLNAKNQKLDILGFWHKIFPR